MLDLLIYNECRIDVEKNSIPTDIEIIYTAHQLAGITLKFCNELGEELSSVGLNDATWMVGRKTVTIPDNTDYIKINMKQWSQSGVIASTCIYEITLIS